MGTVIFPPPTPSSTKRYVAGVIFGLKLQNVLLIRKNRPDFMAGKLNVIGGHVEKGTGSRMFGRIPETWDDAVVREVKEETGMTGLVWNRFLRLRRPNKEMIGYWAVGKIFLAESITDEPVEIYNIDEISRLHSQGELVIDTAWLISMAHEAALRNTSYYVQDTTEGADAWSALE